VCACACVPAAGRNNNKASLAAPGSHAEHAWFHAWVPWGAIRAQWVGQNAHTLIHTHTHTHSHTHAINRGGHRESPAPTRHTLGGVQRAGGRASEHTRAPQLRRGAAPSHRSSLHQQAPRSPVSPSVCAAWQRSGRGHTTPAPRSAGPPRLTRLPCGRAPRTGRPLPWPAQPCWPQPACAQGVMPVHEQTGARGGCCHLLGQPSHGGLSQPARKVSCQSMSKQVRVGLLPPPRPAQPCGPQPASGARELSCLSMGTQAWHTHARMNAHSHTPPPACCSAGGQRG